MGIEKEPNFSIQKEPVQENEPGDKKDLLKTVLEYAPSDKIHDVAEEFDLAKKKQEREKVGYGQVAVVEVPEEWKDYKRDFLDSLQNAKANGLALQKAHDILTHLNGFDFSNLAKTDSARVEIHNNLLGIMTDFNQYFMAINFPNKGDEVRDYLSPFANTHLQLSAEDVEALKERQKNKDFMEATRLIRHGFADFLNKKFKENGFSDYKMEIDTDPYQLSKYLDQKIFGERKTFSDTYTKTNKFSAQSGNAMIIQAPHYKLLKDNEVILEREGLVLETFKNTSDRAKRAVTDKVKKGKAFVMKEINKGLSKPSDDSVQEEKVKV